MSNCDNISGGNSLVVITEPQQPFCEQCGNNNCVETIDAACVIYHPNGGVNGIDGLNGTNGMSAEQIFELIAELIRNGLNTPLIVFDTASIDLTNWGPSGHHLKADLIVSPDIGNILTVRSNGAYVPSESGFNTISTDCLDIPTTHPTTINMTVGTGLAYIAGQEVIVFFDSTHYFTADVVSYNPISGALVLTSISNVGTGNFCNWTVDLASLFGNTPIITKDTVTLNLSGDGTLTNPLFGDVNVSAAPGNEILIFPDGLWSPQLIHNGLVYGGIVTWTGVDFTYDISPAGYYINNVFYTSPGTTVSLAPADPTFPRIDTFIVDNTSTASVLTGTPSDNPQEPSINPATQLRIDIALVPAGAVVPPSASIECLYKEDVEWNATTNTARINLASASVPYDGLLDIEGTNTITGDAFLLTRPGGPFTPMSTFTTLSFKIRVKSDWATSSKKLVLRWELGGVQVGTALNLMNGVLGLNTSNTATYQIISIPLSSFGLNNLSSVDSFRVTVNTDTAIGWYIDDICISNADAAPVGLPLILNNGLNLNYATSTGQLGGVLLHNTTNDTGYFIHTLQGQSIYDYPYQFYQNQAFGDATAQVSFKSRGGYQGLAADFQNAVRFGINYTSSVYPGTPSNLPGYLNDKIGYWIGPNATGNGSFGLRTDDTNSKISGIFFHTLDSSYTDAVTIFAKHPPNPLYQAPIAGGLPSDTLEPYRIVIFHDNRDSEFLGKTFMNLSRFEEAKGVNVASANNLTLGLDGNLFAISGSTQINAITTADWQAGSIVEFVFIGSPLLKQNTAGGAGTAPMKLAGSVDYAAAPDDTIQLLYDGSFWHEIGRKVASGGGAGILSADNGLNLSTPTNVQLGGPLLHITTVASGQYQLNITGNDNSNSPLHVTNTIGFAPSIFAESPSGGVAVRGVGSSGAGGVFGETDSSQAIQGIATTGVALAGLITSTGLPLWLQTTPSSTNSVIEVVQSVRNTSGTASSGIGQSWGLYAQTSTGASRISNQIISKWTTATDASRVSQLIITGVDNAITSDLFTLDGNGRTQLNKYGIGTFVAPETYIAGWDAQGHFVEIDPATIISSGGGLTAITADNGLTANTVSNVQLGGTTAPGRPLIHDTYIDNQTFILALTGTAANVFSVTNTNGTFGNAIVAVSSKSNAVNGTSTDGDAISGASTNGYGGSFSSANADALLAQANTGIAVTASTASGTGVYSISNTGLAGKFLVQPPSTNTVVSNIQLLRDSTGGAGADGIGSSLDWYIKASDSVGHLSNQIISKWTTAAFGGRNSQLVITGVNGTTTVDKMYIGAAATQINATRFEEYRGADVTAANDLTLGTDGNTFDILGATQINAITRANWQAGSRIHLIFSAALTVKNNTAGGVGTDPILLAGGVDFVSATNDVLTLVYSGSFWHETARKLASSGGAAITADNGLNISSLNNVQLGGTLLHNTTVNIAGFTTTWQGTLNSGTMFFMNNTGATSSNALNAQSNGSGIGVQGSSVSSIGVWGISSSNYGVFASSTTGTALGASVDPSSTNTIVNVGVFERKTSGSPASGIGGALQFQVQDSTGATNMTTRFSSQWIDPTFATRTSQLDVIGENVGSDNTIASFYGPGVVGIGISSAYTATRLNVVDNSVGGASIMDLNSTSTAAASNLQKGINVSLSGANLNSNQFTYGIYVNNSHSGTNNQNYGVYATTSNEFSGAAISGNATGAYGVQGVSTNNTAVVGSSNSGSGGVFSSTSGIGIDASTVTGTYAGSFTTNPASTNSITEVARFIRNTSGTAVNGIGGHILLVAEVSDGTGQSANKLKWSWVNATSGTRTSQFDIVGTNSTADNTIASFYGPGVVGIGISSSYTATRLNVVDNGLAGANLVDLTSTSTAAASNLQTMLHIALSGANATTTQTTYCIDAHNDHSGTSNVNIAIKGSVTNEANNQSIGVFGLAASGNGVQGQSTSGNGGQFSSSSGVGANISSTSNYAIFASSGSSKGIGMNTTTDISGEFIRTVTTDAAAEVMRIQTNRSGAGGGVGLGPQLNFDAHNSANAVKVAGAITCTWTSPTASSEASKMVLSNTNAGTTAAAITISGAGAIQFNTYGSGTLTTDASGNITATSDEKLKNILGTYEGGVAEIKKIKPIRYKWNKKSGFDRKNTYIGFSAQNIKKALGDGAVGKGKNGYLTIQDRAILATLVNAVKQQQQEIKQLKAQIKKLSK